MAERRSHPRVRINGEFEAIDAFVAEYAINLSESGVFIRSKDPPAVGTLVNLKFTVIGDELYIIEAMGEVVRRQTDTDGNVGMAVRFVELSAESAARIREVVDRVYG